MMNTSLRFAFLFALASAVGCGTSINGDGEGGEGGEGGGDEGGGGEGGGAEGPTPCETPQRACNGENSVQYCFIDEEGDEEWTQCCNFDEEFGRSFGLTCQCTAPWAEPVEPGDCETPLVLSFDGRAVTFTSEPGATFNLTRLSETSVRSDWPTSATPWLALDVNGNGTIDDGGELFGSATRVGDRFASNGFVALAALDQNGDGVVDAADPAFSSLLIWRDADHSRTSQASELTLASLEVLSLGVTYGIDRRCDDRGNCEVERGSFQTIDAHGNIVSGDIVDVHLRHE